MPLLPSRSHRSQQCCPGFEAPGQRGDNHVCPIALKAVKWCPERPHVALVLLDHVVLLSTSIVSFEYNLFGGTFPIISYVKEALRIVEQRQLPSALREIFPNYDDAVSAAAVSWRIFEFRNVLAIKLNIGVATLFNNSALYVVRTFARFSLDFVASFAFEFFPVILSNFLSFFHQIRPFGDAKYEPYVPFVPAIQVLRLRKVCIATERL